MHSAWPSQRNSANSEWSRTSSTVRIPSLSLPPSALSPESLTCPIACLTCHLTGSQLVVSSKASNARAEIVARIKAQQQAKLMNASAAEPSPMTDANGGGGGGPASMTDYKSFGADPFGSAAAGNVMGGGPSSAANASDVIASMFGGGPAASAAAAGPNGGGDGDGDSEPAPSRARSKGKGKGKGKGKSRGKTPERPALSKTQRKKAAAATDAAVSAFESFSVKSDGADTVMGD
jgi:hypothetical protein